MEKLERYLDQVCQTIGGPPQMREHLRQELREHLLDAIAQHKAAGLSEDAAMAKALDEFGKPDEVRSDLEAAHGQRRWFIDKALEWKEKTMRAKWLWMTWATLAVCLVILLAAAWITFANIFITPKFQVLMAHGYIDQTIIDDSDVMWMPNFLVGVSQFFGSNTTWVLLASLVVWGLFEWRVKSENKAWMRLSALGTVGVALLAVGVLMAASFVITFCLGIPAMGRMARPWAVEQVIALDASMTSLDKALTKQDWPAMQEQAEKGMTHANRLLSGPAVTSLALGNEQGKIAEFRSCAQNVQSGLHEIQIAIREHDIERSQRAIDATHKALQPLTEATKRPKRES